MLSSLRVNLCFLLSDISRHFFRVVLVHKLFILIRSKSQPPPRGTLRFLSSPSIWLFTLDSFPVVWLLSVATPLRATVMETTAGDRLRLWFSLPPHRLHSLFLPPHGVLSRRRGVCVAVPTWHCLLLSLWLRLRINCGSARVVVIRRLDPKAMVSLAGSPDQTVNTWMQTRGHRRRERQWHSGHICQCRAQSCELSIFTNTR